jgi:hypothetical protein
VSLARESDLTLELVAYNVYDNNYFKIRKEERCLHRWKVTLQVLDIEIVEYWRNRYQRMNKERFVAANAIAIITHTLVIQYQSQICCRLSH